MKRQIWETFAVFGFGLNKKIAFCGISLQDTPGYVSLFAFVCSQNIMNYWYVFNSVLKPKQSLQMLAMYCINLVVFFICKAFH